MLTVLVALALLSGAVVGVYLLLKGMGRDGVEAAAPGSCRSGRCGVQPRAAAEAAPAMTREHYVRVDEIGRKGAISSDEPRH